MLQIEDMLGYCLQVKRVRVQVPHDKSSVAVDLDGITMPLSACGTGIEQLMFIAAGAIAFGSSTVLLEEPELHLHPTVQRRMMRYFQDSLDNQFFITTHSATILDSTPGTIVQITNRDGKAVGNVTAGRKHYEAVFDLGHRPSDLLQSNFIVWVEGPSDRIYIKHWLKLGAPELEEGSDYQIMFYGGRLLSHLTLDGEIGRAHV